MNGLPCGWSGPGWGPGGRGESDKCGGIGLDSLITAAARALAAGDPFGALNRVALREDAPALALRGIAMAQLGDLARARSLLRRAARGVGPGEGPAWARPGPAGGGSALRFGAPG